MVVNFGFFLVLFVMIVFVGEMVVVMINVGMVVECVEYVFNVLSSEGNFGLIFLVVNGMICYGVF